MSTVDRVLLMIIAPVAVVLVTAAPLAAQGGHDDLGARRNLAVFLHRAAPDIDDHRHVMAA